MKVSSKELVLSLIILLSNSLFAKESSTSQVNWIAASVKMAAGADRQPNAFYNWTSNVNDAWQASGLLANAISYGKDDRGQGVWLAVNVAYSIQYSTDGLNWNNATCPDHYCNVSKIEYGYDLNNRGLWVAVGDGGIYYSTDGRVWRTARYNSNPEFRAVSYGNHKWIAVGLHGAVHTSVDGINWEDHSLSQDKSFITIGFGKIGVTPGWIIVGDKNLWSTDGINWNNYSDPYIFDNKYWDTIKYANGTWMAANPGIISSKDGKHWIREHIPASTSYMGDGIGHGKDTEGKDMWIAFYSNEMFALKEGSTTWQKLNFKSATSCVNNYVYISSNEVNPIVLE